MKRSSVLVALVLAAGVALGFSRHVPAVGACHARGHGLYSRPDRICTPGATDPRVTQRNLAATICRRGWSATVRPPESVTEPLKRALLRSYGDRGRIGSYELDHLVALELGGAPADVRNLWPEPGASPNPKDRLENALRALTCRGRVRLDEAQRALAGDWVLAARRLQGGADALARYLTAR